METDLNSLERYTRSFNFRILGLPERKDENCVDSVHQILKDKFGIATTVIENAHRVGLSRDDKLRQMIARFYSRATRRAVMTSARENSSKYRNTLYWRPYSEGLGRETPPKTVDGQTVQR